MDKIAETTKGDYFILPSSVHETIILPDNGAMTAKELEAMVTEINATQVEPWDRLTDQVYHYDPIDRVFEKAATFLSACSYSPTSFSNSSTFLFFPLYNEAK